MELKLLAISLFVALLNSEHVLFKNVHFQVVVIFQTTKKAVIVTVVIQYGLYRRI